MGNGPDDILYGQFIDKVGERCFQVVDGAGQKTLVYNLDSILKKRSFVPIRSFFYSDLKLNKDEFVQNCYYVNDTLKWGLGASARGKYFCIGSHSLTYAGAYPELADMENPFYFYQGVLHISFDRNWVLYHSPIGYYYELYRKSGEEWKQVLGMKSLMGLVLFFVLFSCQGASYKDKICNKYIGKELVYFPDSDLVNEKHVQEKYRLIHTLDITCSSCLNEISDNISFINWLDEQHVAFEIIGYSSYKDSVFNPALLEYPLCLAFLGFCTQQKRGG